MRSHFNDDSEGGAPDFSIMHAALAALDDAADEEEGEIDNSASVVDEEDEEGGTSRITLQARIDFLVRKMKRGRGGRSAGSFQFVFL